MYLSYNIVLVLAQGGYTLCRRAAEASLSIIIRILRNFVKKSK
jgi:hypothetical protein